jgi:hypothetical protein
VRCFFRFLAFGSRALFALLSTDETDPTILKHRQANLELSRQLSWCTEGSDWFSSWIKKKKQCNSIDRAWPWEIKSKLRAAAAMFLVHGDGMRADEDPYARSGGGGCMMLSYHARVFVRRDY